MWATCLILIASDSVFAAPKKKWNVVKKLAVNRQAEAVELFEGIDKGLLEARLIPRNADGGNLFIANKSDRPLTVKLPKAFAAVQVLKQGFGGQGGGVGGAQNGSGGGQSLGGGAGAGGLGGGLGGFGGGGGAGLFTVAPEETAKIPMKSVWNTGRRILARRCRTS